MLYVFFFFNDAATAEIYSLSLHAALPICGAGSSGGEVRLGKHPRRREGTGQDPPQSHPRRVARRLNPPARSEEHTSELQSRQYLVCRFLLEKKIEHSVASLPYSHRTFLPC